MSVTDDLLANDQRHAESSSGPLPLPPWASEAFPDLEADVRASVARITDSPFVPLTDSVRGFVFDVATGRLHEVG